MNDMRKLMCLALAAGTTLAVVGAANPAVAKGDSKTDCVVQHVDERGEVRDTTTEPVGSKRGVFVCAGGKWEFSWVSGESITTTQVQVDPAGTVSVRDFDRPERSRDLTLGEMATISQAVNGSDAVVFTRVVVAVDDGKKRTAAEVEALLAGKDTTGAKVLRTIDRPDPSATTQDYVDEIGDQGPTVVYLLGGIWDAISGAFSDAINWVVDGINDIGDWINDHCIWFPPPPPGSTDIPIITCEF